MLKNKKGLELFITSIAMSSIATGTAIAISWVWSNNASSYEEKYNKTQDYINSLRNLDVPVDLIEEELNKLPDKYFKNEQFNDLDRILNNLKRTIENNVSSKLSLIKNLDKEKITDTLSKSKTIDELLDFVKSLNNVIQFDQKINDLQNNILSDNVTDKLLSDLSSKNTGESLNDLNKYLSDQKQRISNLNEEITNQISLLPDELKEKYINLKSQAKDNLNKLEELNQLLNKVLPIVEQARKINDKDDKQEIYNDLNNASSDKELEEIKQKIQKLLVSEDNKVFENIKDQLLNLSNGVLDSNKRNDFINSINDSRNLDELTEVKRKLEEEIKKSSGLDGLLNAKKKILLERVKQSDLTNEIKTRYNQDINSSNSIKELDTISEELDKLLSLNKLKNDVNNLINKLNQEKREEFNQKLNDANDVQAIKDIANKINEILDQARIEAKKQVDLLQGNSQDKNDLELKLVNSNTESEINKIKNDASNILNNIKSDIENSLNSITDSNLDAKKQELTEKFNNLKNNADSNFGQFNNLLDEVKNLNSVQETKKQTNDIYNQLDNKENVADLKNQIDSETNLNNLLETKNQLNDLLTLSDDKKSALEEIQKINHNTKKEELKSHLDTVTKKHEIYSIKNNAQDYHQRELDNKVLHDDLILLADNINNNEEKNRVKGLIESAMNDSNNQPNINQVEISEKLIQVRTEFYNVLNNLKDSREVFKIQKSIINSDINKIKDNIKVVELRQKLNQAQNIDDLNNLSEVVDNELEIQRLKDKIKNKLDYLFDQKDYPSRLVDINNLSDLKELEQNIDNDLIAQESSLNTLKEKIKNDILKLSDNNENKPNLFNDLSNTDTLAKAQVLEQKATSLLNEIKEKTTQAILKTEGDQTLNEDLNNKLNLAVSEDDFNNIIKLVNNAFSDKKSEIIQDLNNLNNDVLKVEFTEKLNNAKNISELNNLKQELQSLINSTNQKQSIQEKIDKIQDIEKQQELQKLLDLANTENEINSVATKVDEQLQKETTEIQNNINTVKSKISQLYKPNNIELFTNETNKYDDESTKHLITLPYSRSLLNNINNTILLEQSELEDKKRSAKNEVINRLINETKIQELRDKIQSSKNIQSVDLVLKELNDEINNLRNQAQEEINKLIDNARLTRQINNANTEATINNIKNIASNYLNNLKSDIQQKINTVISVSSNINQELLNKLEQVNTESEMLLVSQQVDIKLSEYNNKTQSYVDRLKDKSHIISKDLWTSELISKSQRDKVIEIINHNWTEYEQLIEKLTGDQANKDKFRDKLNSYDKQTVLESDLIDDIKVMEEIFNSEKTQALSLLDKVVILSKKSEFTELINKANTIARLKEIQELIKLQIKKESAINSLTNKNLFPEQRRDFIQKINNAKNNEELNEIINQINAKSNENKDISNLITQANELNKLINQNTPKHNEIQSDINNVRSLEQGQGVIAKINAYLNEQKSQTQQAVNKLVNKELKNTYQSLLDSSNSESEINQIASGANNIFSRRQTELVVELNKIIDSEKRTELQNKLNNALNLQTLDEISVEIENQLQKEAIQKNINRISDSESKNNLLSELNNSNDKQSLDVLKNKVNEKLKNQIGDLDFSKELATEELKRLLETNAKRVELTNTLNNATTVEVVNQVINDVETEIQIIKTTVKNELNTKIQPSNRENDALWHNQIFTSLTSKVDQTNTEQKLNEISSVDIVNYLNSVKSLYKSKLDKIPNNNKETEISTIQNAINSSGSTNSLDAELTKANELMKNIVLELNNTLLDETKKNEFITKINNITIINENKQKFITIIDDLLNVYNEIQNQQRNQNNELSLLKEQIKEELALLLKNNDLLTTVNNATTKEQVLAVKEEIKKQIQMQKDLAFIEVNKLTDDSSKDNLTNLLTTAQSEYEINKIKDQAIQIFKITKDSLTDTINQITDETEKQKLLTQKDDANNQTIQKLNEIKNQARLIKSKEETKELLNGLQDKKDYLNQINQATDISTLNEIKSAINQYKLNQSIDLLTAKQEAQAIIDKTNSKSTLDEELKNAHTIPEIKAVKDKAQVLIENTKQQALTELAKLVGHAKHNEYLNQINQPNNSEPNLLRIKDEINELFENLKNDAQTYIHNSVSDQRDTLLNELPNATNYEAIDKLKLSSDVYHKANQVNSEIKNVVDKKDFEQRLNNIINTRPNTLEEKNNKIKELEQLLDDIEAQRRKEVVDLGTLKNRANNIIARIDIDINKRLELEKTIANTQNPVEVNNKQQEAINILKNDYDATKNILNKLSENFEPRLSLEAKLNQAIKQSEIQEVKNQALDFLKNLKTSAQELTKKFGNEKDGELNNVIATDKQQAYEDYINKLNNELQSLKEQGLSKLNQVQNPESRSDYENQLNNASTKQELQNIINNIDLESARQDALVEINKLSVGNIKKQTLLNTINNTTDISEITNAKNQAIQEFNNKKTQATNSVAKLAGDISEIQFKSDLENAANEYELNRIIDIATRTFNNARRDAQNEINKLVKDNSQFSVVDKDTITKLKELETQILTKAKEHAQEEINKLGEEDKKHELEAELQRAETVESANEVRTKAINALGSENALAQAKGQARNSVNKLKDSNEKTNMLNAINNSATPEEALAIGRQAQNIINEKLNELSNLRNKFNTSNDVLRANQGVADNQVAIENAITNLQNELSRLQREAEASLEKINVDDYLLIIREYSNEKDDYNRLKPILERAISNPLQDQFDSIKAESQNIFENRKTRVLVQINRLVDSDQKTALLTEINDPGTDTRSKLIEIERKTQKRSEADKIKDKIAGIKDISKKNEFNRLADDRNTNLTDLERRVDEQLNREARELQRAKQAALNSIAKLPASEQSNPRNIVNSSDDINIINGEKSKADTRLNNLIAEVQSEINKMPSNARTDLNNRLNQTRNNGDGLLSLKNIATNTVNKSNDLQSTIDRLFANHPQHKAHFSNVRNSANADTIAEIDTIKNSLQAIANKVQEAKTVHNTLSALTNTDRNNFLNRINSANDVNTLQTIINDMKFAKARQEAQNAINALDQGNRSTLQNQFNLANDISGYNNVTNTAKALKTRIDQARRWVNNTFTQQGNKNTLLNELSNAKTIDNVINIEIKINPLKSEIDLTKNVINQVIDNNKKNEFNNRLNSLGTKESVDQLRSKVERYNREVSRAGAPELLRRLKDGTFKNEKSGIINSDTQSPANILRAKQEVQEHLNNVKNNATRENLRLSVTNNLYGTNFNKLTDNNTELEYEQVIQSVNNEITNKRSQALQVINRLSTNTINNLRLKEGFDNLNTLTEGTIQEKQTQATNKLNELKNETQRELNKIQGANEYNSYLNTLNNPSATESQYLDVKNNTIRIYNAEINKINPEINKITNPNKRSDFEQRRNSARNITELRNLYNELLSYYEVKSFTPERSNYINENVNVNVTLNKSDGARHNKYLYLVARNTSGQKVVSQPIQLTSTNLRFTFNVNSFNDNGQYSFDKLVWSNTNNRNSNDIVNSNDTFDTYFETNRSQNFNITKSYIIANDVRASFRPSYDEEYSSVSGRDLIEATYNYYVTVSGLSGENLLIDTSKNVEVQLEVLANTGNATPINKNHNLVTDNLITISSNYIVSASTTANNRTINHNWRIYLKRSQLKAGFNYKIRSIKFHAKTENNTPLGEYIYTTDKSNGTNAKLVNYGTNHNYSGSTYAEALIFRQTNKVRFNYEYSGLAHHSGGPNLDSNPISRLAFQDGWTMKVFAELLNYLNGRVPNTTADYTSLNPLNTSAKLTLRQKWVDWLTDKLVKAFMEIRYKNEHAKLPNDYRAPEIYSLPAIQLGLGDQNTRFLQVWENGKYRPILGGSNLGNIFTSQISNNIDGTANDYKKFTSALEHNGSYYWLMSLGSRREGTIEVKGWDYTNQTHEFWPAIQFAIEFLLKIKTDQYSAS
ncbi:hypothetical protein [Mycoplasmopsis felis]|uniref:hypothetical protein n=1 Tax=Mycoplasmopsis felis TaxID=33923 RepID=UPI002AFDCA88|nr:hypothetical protein [Mycoplasmopsis felis]WQQ03442.1 hypothetical protein RRG38_01095 [Mycoplasmopsis felis]